MIYFDHNATTPLDPAVLEAMFPCLGPVFGNPSSVHRCGRAARNLLDDARERAAHVLGTKPSELIFTSGGTESNNLAILGSARALRDRGRHLITSSIEHHAVLHCFQYLQREEGFRVTVLPVDADGCVDPDALEASFQADTVLVSIMAANNEVGTLQDVAGLGRRCAARGIQFHTDAVQWMGKEPLARLAELEAPLVSLCGHKFHGPKGSGLLFAKSGARFHPCLLGGPQENERRAGTENLANLVGLACALEKFVQPPVFPREELRRLTGLLRDTCCRVPGVVSRGSALHCLPNTVALTVEGCDSLALLAGLDLEGICASSGSACSAGALNPSHVLLAMGVPPALAHSFVRFSLGRESTEVEVKRVAEVFLDVVERVRRA